MHEVEKFEITKETKADKNIVFLKGEFDLSMAPEVTSAVEPLIGQTDRKLILNLRDLRYIDSTGIGIIISILKRRDELGAGFSVDEVPSKIQRLFDLTGISKFLRPDTNLH